MNPAAPVVPQPRPAPIVALERSDPAEAAGFRLLGRLATGGFGHIYLGRRAVDHAVDPGGDPYTLAAVKLLKQEYSGNAQHLQRFHQESKALLRGAGARIPELLSFEFDAGRPPAIATRFIPGPSLHQVMAAHGGALPAETGYGVGADLVDTLLAAHDQGVWHRDLHPGNVLLTADGPWIIDFGLTRIRGQQLTRPLDQAFGNPHYCAPEQLGGLAETDAATDVFGIAAVLLYLLTGHAPYPGPRAPAGRAADLSGLPRGRAGRAVAACLAVRAGDRPSLGELRAALGEVGALALPAGVRRELDAHRTRLTEFLRDADNEADLTVPFRPGRRSWSRRVGEWAHALVAVGDDTVATADGAGRLHWLHPGTGAVQRTDVGFRPPVRLCAGERVILVRDAAGRLEAWDTVSRTRRWSVPEPEDRVAAPALLHGRNVLLVDAGGRVHHFDADTRRVWWRGEPLPDTTALAVGRQRVYALIDHGLRLHALDDEDGRAAWPAPLALRAPVRAAPLPEQDAVYLADTRGALYCVAAADGTPRWRVRLGAPVVAAPVRVGDSVVVGDTAGVVHARDLATGAERWRSAGPGGDEVFALCATGTTVVWGGWQGRLHVVDGLEGASLQSFDMRGQVLALACAPAQGAVYAATTSGEVHGVPL
ncbi:PQQ-binding-like beta-propeller repeat protein [Streptomyces humi]|uniref:outer membrane protein assembly factor BamB family protein n=1 Tax=Streptomyces humi TaxID=1428620 RepID=UPI00069A7815|nr:PQQ-binding-like beta-propeller repeat protein [Streptomyces humi]